MTRIVDLTAGNRTYWKKGTKHLSGVTYCDIESQLEIKPDKIEDFRKTTFEDGSVDVIFLDPPHLWRHSKCPSIFTVPNRIVMKEVFGKTWGERPPRYYGWDKFKTEKELMEAIRLLVIECYRILENHGLIWLRWSEICIPYKEILKLFSNLFKECFRLPISSTYKSSRYQTIWACFIKGD